MQRLFLLPQPQHPVSPSDAHAIRPAELPSVLAITPYLVGPRKTSAPFVFHPDSPVNREDAATAVARLLLQFTTAKPLTATEQETALTGISDASKISPTARPFAATVIHLGILRPLTAGTFNPQSAVTLGDLQNIVSTVENNFLPTRALPCPLIEQSSLRAVQPRVIEVEPAKFLNPSLADMCQNRADIFGGGVVTLTGATGPQFSALIGKSIPAVSAEARLVIPTIPQPGRKTRPKAVTQLVPLKANSFGVYSPRGQAPEIFEGLVAPNGANAGSANLRKWAQQVVKSASVDPPCNVASGAPGNAGLLTGWTCYQELQASAAVTCLAPNCSNFGTEALVFDGLRHNGSPPGFYMLVSSWQTDPGGTCDSLSYPNVFPPETTCGPHVSQLSVSMPVGAVDTSFTPSSTGPTWCSPSFTPCMYSSGPGTSQGTVSTQVSDTVGATGGISGGNLGGGLNGSIGFQQSWTMPDISILTNTSGQGFPPNTGSWVEQFTPAHYGYSSQVPPPPDALGHCTGGSCGAGVPNEAAGFQVSDTSGPFAAEVDGIGVLVTDHTFWVPPVPSILAPLFGFFPVQGVSDALVLDMSGTIPLQAPEFVICTSINIIQGGGTCAATPQDLSGETSVLQAQIAPGGQIGVLVYAMEEGFQSPLAWSATPCLPNITTPCGSSGTIDNDIVVTPCGSTNSFPPSDCNNLPIDPSLSLSPGIILATITASSTAPATEPNQPIRVLFDLLPAGLADSNLELDVTVTQSPGPLWRPPFLPRKCSSTVLKSVWCQP
ncbi:MAG: S-layer homology domain-containing protein [Candidatus Acidiferrales bacterium]